MDNRMRKIITSLIAILVVTNLEAQQRTPKLVVCITVDQLRGDYVEYFYNTFGERGFKRLMNEGLVYNNIKFEFPTSTRPVPLPPCLLEAIPASMASAAVNTTILTRTRKFPSCMMQNISATIHVRIILLKVIQLHDRRRTENSFQRKKRRLCHRSRCGKCDPFGRTCGKRCFLDGRCKR